MRGCLRLAQGPTMAGAMRRARPETVGGAMKDTPRPMHNVDYPVRVLPPPIPVPCTTSDLTGGCNPIIYVRAITANYLLRCVATRLRREEWMNYNKT